MRYHHSNGGISCLEEWYLLSRKVASPVLKSGISCCQRWHLVTSQYLAGSQETPLAQGEARWTRAEGPAATTLFTTLSTRDLKNNWNKRLPGASFRFAFFRCSWVCHRRAWHLAILPRHSGRRRL